jgi:hypothetical protein
MPPIGDAQLANMFDYHAPTAESRPMHETVRQTLKTAAVMVHRSTPECPEQTTAIRHIEMAMFYANAAIARNVSAVAPVEGRQPETVTTNVGTRPGT